MCVVYLQGMIAQTDASLHRVSGSGTQMLCSHQEGIQGGSSTPHMSLGVLHSQYKGVSGQNATALSDLKLWENNDG